MGLAHRPSRGRAVRDGARVRGSASALRLDARRAGRASGPATRRAARGIRARRRRCPGSLPGGARRPEPARRDGRGAAARMRDRRRAMARPSLPAGIGVRRAAPAGGADRHGVRGPRARRRKRARRPAGALRRRARRSRRAQGARVRYQRTIGHARPRPDRGRDAWQPTRAAGAAAWADTGRAGGRVRPARPRPAVGADRAELPAAFRVAPTRLALAPSHRGGRADRRRHPALARARPNRDRAGSGRARGSHRADRARCTSAISASARTLGDLPGSGCSRPPAGPSRPGRGDRS